MIFTVLTLFCTALGMNLQPLSPVAKELSTLAKIDEVAKPLFINTFLGKIDEVEKILNGFPEYLHIVLDCNQSIRCPLQSALMRGHFDIARLLLSHMKKHIPHTCIEDLFMRWNYPMMLDMISRGDKQAVKFIFEIIIEEHPDGDGLSTKFCGWNVISYATSIREYEMVSFLTELGCQEEPPKTTIDAFSQVSSSDPPKKSRSDGLLSSSGSPRKTSSGYFTPPKSGSKHRFHIDLHFGSRSNSKSPREKSSLEGGSSQSAPESPKTPDTTSSSPRKSSKSLREKHSLNSSRSSLSEPDSPKTLDSVRKSSSKIHREKTSLGSSRSSISDSGTPRTPDGTPKRSSMSLQEKISLYCSRSAPESPKTVETCDSPRKSSKNHREKTSHNSSRSSLSATESPKTQESEHSPRKLVKNPRDKSDGSSRSCSSISAPDSSGDTESKGTEELSGSSQAQSDTGSSTSSDSVVRIRKKSNGSLLKRMKSPRK